MKYNERLILPKQAWYVSAEILPCWINKQNGHLTWTMLTELKWACICENKWVKRSYIKVWHLMIQTELNTHKTLFLADLVAFIGVTKNTDSSSCSLMYVLAWISEKDWIQGYGNSCAQIPPSHTEYMKLSLG